MTAFRLFPNNREGQYPLRLGHRSIKMKTMQFSTVLLILLFSLLAAAFPHRVASADGTIIIRDGEVEIETFIFGEGQNTLIIAAGNARPAAQLDELAQSIAASGIQVVTYNYRGIGASKGPIVGITLHDYADDVWRIANALELDKVHLAGKTYGNRVMRTAAADKPERVLSVILVGAGGDILPSEETQMLYRRYIDPEISKEEWETLQGELMFAPGNEHLASQSASLGAFPELAAAQVKANDATPKSEWIGGGAAPMLILTCLQDRIAVPENALNLAKSRTNTWVIGIPQCGHNMLYERPEDLRRLIVEHITLQ
jgi:pimeloyl-ACP methyl ester carboxylesterase